MVWLFLCRFIAIEQLRFGKEDSLRVLISSEQVYFLGRSDPDRDNIVLQVTYAELYHCRSIALGMSYYLTTFKKNWQVPWPIMEGLYSLPRTA